MNTRRWIVIAGAGLAAVVGGGAALGATGSKDPSSDFLGDVANRLGISKDKLEGAIEDASIARIDAAVDRGDLTREQGEELKKQVRSGAGPQILPGFRGPKLGIGPLGPPEKLHRGKRGFGPRGFGPPGLGPPRFGPPGPPGKGVVPGIDLLDKAADYLGLDAANVRKELRDGKSLADLAREEGKSVDGLKDALRDAIRKDAGRFADKLAAHVDDLVEGRFEAPHPPAFAPG